MHTLVPRCAVECQNYHDLKLVEEVIAVVAPKGVLLPFPVSRDSSMDAHTVI